MSGSLKGTDAEGRPSTCLDRVEFDRLAAVHRARAARFACAFLGDRELAEDLVQEALLRLYERREQYPLASHFGPFLVKILARLCIDEKRTRQAARRWRATAVPLTADDPAGVAEQRETAALIAAAIGALPPRERACFLLAVCEGLSYREAADVLGLSCGDVNNAVHRARLSLRKALGPYTGSDADTPTAAVEGEKTS